MKCCECGKRMRSERGVVSFYGPFGGKTRYAHKTCRPDKQTIAQQRKNAKRLAIEKAKEAAEQKSEAVPGVIDDQ